jgi:hypothetical protein
MSSKAFAADIQALRDIFKWQVADLVVVDVPSRVKEMPAVKTGAIL